MEKVLMPYEVSEEFVVEITYQGGSRLQARNDKLMEAIKEASAMEAFGLAVDTSRVFRKTKQMIERGGIYSRVYEMIA